MPADASTEPAPPGLGDYALLTTLGAMGGASFLFVSLAIDQVPPMTMTAARLVIAAVILWGAVAVSGEKAGLGQSTLAWLLAVAVAGYAMPFTLISWGQQEVSAGLTAIIVAGMPLLTVVLAHFFVAGEPLGKRKLAGVLLGLAGLVVLFGPGAVSGGGDLVHAAAILLAAVGFAVGAVLMKRLSSLPPRTLSAWLLTFAAALMVPASLFAEAPWQLRPDAQSVLAVIALGVLPTAVATLMIFAIMRRQGASFYAQAYYLIPLFGVFWAFVFLGELPSAAALIALCFILAGIAVARASRARNADLPSGAMKP